MTKSTLVAVLALCAFTGTASASDTLQSRAFSALSVAIADQGNAALVQIRKELKDSAIQAVRPFLPESEKAPEDKPQPAEKPAAQH